MKIVSGYYYYVLPFQEYILFYDVQIKATLFVKKSRRIFREVRLSGNGAGSTMFSGNPNAGSSQEKNNNRVHDARKGSSTYDENDVLAETHVAVGMCVCIWSNTKNTEIGFYRTNRINSPRASLRDTIQTFTESFSYLTDRATKNMVVSHFAAKNFIWSRELSVFHNMIMIVTSYSDVYIEID